MAPRAVRRANTALVHYRKLFIIHSPDFSNQDKRYLREIEQELQREVMRSAISILARLNIDHTLMSIPLAKVNYLSLSLYLQKDYSIIQANLLCFFLCHSRYCYSSFSSSSHSDTVTAIPPLLLRRRRHLVLSFFVLSTRRVRICVRIGRRRTTAAKKGKEKKERTNVPFCRASNTSLLVICKNNTRNANTPSVGSSSSRSMKFSTRYAAAYADGSRRLVLVKCDMQIKRTT